MGSTSDASEVSVSELWLEMKVLKEFLAAPADVFSRFVSVVP